MMLVHGNLSFSFIRVGRSILTYIPPKIFETKEFITSVTIERLGGNRDTYRLITNKHGTYLT